MKDEHGVVTKYSQEIERLVLGFFENLYTKIPRVRFIPLINDWPCVAPTQNTALTSQFTEEEIYLAVKTLGRNKAPGPDGSTTEFLINIGCVEGAKGVST